MTHHRSAFSLNRPGALIAALPAVLGFVPADSLVVASIEDGHLGAVMRADLERALALQTELLGPEAADLSYVLSALGDLALDQRHCSEAEASYLRAVQVLGDDAASSNPTALQPLIGLARAAACRDDFAAARKGFTRALELAERSFGADELRTAEIADHLGDMLLRAGDPEAAQAEYRRAQEIRKRRLPANAPAFAESLRRLAELQRRAGKYPDALALLQQAQTLREGGPMVESAEAALLRLRLGTGQGTDCNLVPVAAEVANHVEGTDLPAPLGWIRKTVTNVKDVH